VGKVWPASKPEVPGMSALSQLQVYNTSILWQSVPVYGENDD